MKLQFFKNPALVISLLISLAAVSVEIPFWISLFLILMIGWKFLNEKFSVPKIAAKYTPIIGVFIFIVVYLQYKTIIGQEASTTIIFGLAAITILNYETERDFLFLVLLGFMIVIDKTIFTLDLIWLVPTVLSFFGLWYSIISTQKMNKLKFLFWNTFKSIPILVLLFVFFPRIVLFQTTPTHKIIAQSGYSEDLMPGRFSEIALQNQVVFRAEFQNQEGIVQAHQLYWRGTVLDKSNGFFWRKSNFEKKSHSPIKTSRDLLVNYKVILEPQSLKTVFALDTPVMINDNTVFIEEFSHRTYRFAQNEQQQVQYEGLSTFSQNIKSNDDQIDDEDYLAISPLPPKSQAWVSEIKNKFPLLQDRARALKQFFLKPGFVYTLHPDNYKNNLDEFLFERKKGFCEHYAAAFATLARALDIPSRVVVGYQGGTYNSLGKFWKISQKDSHAWVELGLDGNWQRYDPTDFVAPLRISMGGESYFSLSENEQIQYSKISDWQRPISLSLLWDEFSSVFENLNYHWSLFLLNYDLQTQLDFLKKFDKSWIFEFLFLVGLLIYVLYFKFKKQKNTDKNKHQLYFLFSKIVEWAQKNNFEFEQSETPCQILNKIKKKYPQYSDLIENFIVEYEAVVYQEKKISIDLSNYNRQWASFFKEASSLQR